MALFEFSFYRFYGRFLNYIVISIAFVAELCGFVLHYPTGINHNIDTIVARFRRINLYLYVASSLPIIQILLIFRIYK